MLIVPITDAKPGMVLAAPVNSAEQPEIDLLKRGFTLDQKVIDRLPDYGVEFLYVDYPGLDELDRHIAVQLSPARQKMYQQMKQTISAAQRRTSPGIPYMDYYQTSRDLILTLMGQGQHPVFMDNLSRLGGDAVGHATAVAHLSLLLGIKLELYLIEQRSRLPASHAKEVVNLGVAGMLHDMGKLRLSEGARAASVTQPPEDPEVQKEYESHARESYEAVHDGVEPSAAVAILHHHQRFDGTGFPEVRYRDGTASTPAGEKIHVFARILGAADLYDRLVTPAKGQKRRSNMEALHLMRTQYTGWVDPQILKTLQAVCPPYPPGSTVVLSDGSEAVVVIADAKDVYRPTVRRKLEDGVLDGTPVVLREQANLSVVSVNGLQVEAYLPAEAVAA